MHSVANQRINFYTEFGGSIPSSLRSSNCIWSFLRVSISTLRMCEKICFRLACIRSEEIPNNCVCFCLSPAFPPPSPFRASERPALPVLTLSPPPSAVCLKMLLHNSLPLVLLLKTSRKRLGCSGWLSTSACFDVPGMSDGCPMDVQQVWVRIHSKRRLSARSIREPPLLCGVSSTS